VLRIWMVFEVGQHFLSEQCGYPTSRVWEVISDRSGITAKGDPEAWSSAGLVISRFVRSAAVAGQAKWARR
jgi:hypothetical protein